MEIVLTVIVMLGSIIIWENYIRQFIILQKT